METPLGDPPRYRIEHRHPDASPLIVAYAGTDLVAAARLAVWRSRLLRQGERGELVVVDQATDADVWSRELGKT